jgi:DNA-directed RNA polymerase subunit RPC12/RpoP
LTLIRTSTHTLVADLLAAEPASSTATSRLPPPQKQPSPPKEQRAVACPHCGTSIALHQVRVGQNTCPHCGQAFEAE